LKELLKGLKASNYLTNADVCFDDFEMMVVNYIQIKEDFSDDKTPFEQSWFKLADEISSTGSVTRTCFTSTKGGIEALFNHISLFKDFYQWGELFLSNALGKILTWKATYDEMSSCVTDGNYPCISFYVGRIIYLMFSFTPNDDLDNSMRRLLEIPSLLDDKTEGKGSTKRPNTEKGDMHGDGVSDFFKQFWDFLNNFTEESVVLDNQGIRQCREDLQTAVRVFHDFAHDFDNLTKPLDVAETFVDNFSETLELWGPLNKDCYDGGIETYRSFSDFIYIIYNEPGTYGKFMARNIGNVYNDFYDFAECVMVWEPKCAGKSLGDVMKIVTMFKKSTK
jgi:hypothetical protein